MGAYFYQYETTELTITVRGEGKPLEGYDKIVVSLDQGAGRGMYHGDYVYEAGSPDVDTDASTVTLYMGQEETGRYAASADDGTPNTKVQVNVYYTDHERDVTLEGELTVRENLYRKVIS